MEDLPQVFGVIAHVSVLKDTQDLSVQQLFHAKPDQTNQSALMEELQLALQELVDASARWASRARTARSRPPAGAPTTESCA